jgi:hypothetical protein
MNRETWIIRITPLASTVPVANRIRRQFLA